MCKFISSGPNASKGVDTLDSPNGGFVVTDYDKASLLADIFPESFGVSSQSSESICIGVSPAFNVMEYSVVFKRYDILKILNRWLSSSAITPDGIPLRFIKRIAPHIASLLGFLFNLMFLGPRYLLNGNTITLLPSRRGLLSLTHQIIGHPVSHPFSAGYLRR